MREKICMNSTAGTGHFYTTDKNNRTMPEKLEMKNFDPVSTLHVIYQEGKIKSILRLSLKLPRCWTVPGFFVSDDLCLNYPK